MPAPSSWRRLVVHLCQFGQSLPRFVRSLVGMALVVGGVLGIVLPILGIWMVPLGLMFIALDIPPLRRRAQAWIERLRQEG